jgi:hypothetical protein
VVVRFINQKGGQPDGCIDDGYQSW